jgi:hypothetical protein
VKRFALVSGLAAQQNDEALEGEPSGSDQHAMTKSTGGRVLLEVFAVVGGILIAFALDASWDARSTAVWEVSQLRSLQSEFSENLVHLDEVIRDHEATVDRLVQIVDFARDSPDGAQSLFSDSVVVALVAWRTSDVETATLDGLLAAGRLGDLRNPEVREALAGWPQRVADAEEDEVLARDFAEMILTPALVGQGIIGGAHRVRGGPGIERPESLEVAVTVSPELLDLASARLTHVRLAAGSLVVLRRRGEAIRNLLDSELASRAR